MLSRDSAPDHNTTRIERLDFYYRQIGTVILSRQDPVSGLLPASTAVNAHGNYTDAWVRDNVYSILAVWGLALAYRKVEADSGRTVELEGCVVKLMRGLLQSMMRQAPKVERFKHTQIPGDALHAKYDTSTGLTVVGDFEWGHLQLDATSIFLLMLAQMTASGLDIVLTIDEVNFVQNLIYYIGRTYQTPDYGIWERGNKINSGFPELNASSVGMAKAALEALSGMNIFGVRGSQASMLHVLPDEIARARMTLESLLPWESSSKEVDSALLSVIGFPAFAVEDEALANLTRSRIIERLQGRYGCKRFLRDGHQTVLEDNSRLHYEQWELKQFENIESEWPLFFTYLLLDCLFRKDEAGADRYRKMLDDLVVEREGIPLLPELYFVPADKVAAEKAVPMSQDRLPNDNLPLVWAQSLYYLGMMLQDGLLHLGDIDPLGRHHHLGSRRQATVQVLLLAEDEALQADLEIRGIAASTPEQLAPMGVHDSRALSLAYGQIGRNDKLKLSGRPRRRLRSLATAKVFRMSGELKVFLPAFMDPRQFYLTLDERMLVSQVIGEIAYIGRHWRQAGRPTLTIMMTNRMWNRGREALLQLVGDLSEGWCGDIPVRLAPVSQLLGTAARERIDNLHDFDFADYPLYREEAAEFLLPHDSADCLPLTGSQVIEIEILTEPAALLHRLGNTSNLYEQVDILARLKTLVGLDFNTHWGNAENLTVRDLLSEAYTVAAQGDANDRPYWSLVRRTAGLLGKGDLGLTDAVTDILVRQKQITVGKAYFEDATITRPLPFDDIIDKIRRFAGEDIRELVLTQEILISLSILLRSEPELLSGMLTLRVGYLTLLLTSDLAAETGMRQEEAYEELMDSSPSAIQERLRRVLTGQDRRADQLRSQESLSLRRGNLQDFAAVEDASEVDPKLSESWLRHRERQGALNRLPTDFNRRVWHTLHYCRGLIIGEKMDLRNRLESRDIISETTEGEKNFAFWVEHLLNKIEFPEYRQLNIEALDALAAIITGTPDLYIDDYITMDVLIGHAVRLGYLHRHPERESEYAADKPAAWREFYESAPERCEKYIRQALKFLTEAHGPAN